MPRGNKNPIQTDEFKEQQFKAIAYDENIPLSKKVDGVKLPVDVHEALRSLPDKERIAWMRRTLTEAARRELM